MSSEERQTTEEDDVIYSRIGKFGRWQAWISFSLSLFGIIQAWHILASTFLAPSIEFRCLLPKNASSKVLPRSFNGSEESDQCEVEVLGETVSCEEWEYDNSQFPGTIIQEWDLVCDKAILGELVATSYMAGFIVGEMIFGHVADAIGRRKTLLITAVVNFACGVTAAFSVDIVMLLILRFGVAMSGAALWTTGFVWIMEFFGGKWRTIIGLLFEIPFSCGYMTLALIGYYIHDWRWLILIMHLPLIPYFFILWAVPESPRWQIAKHKFDEAQKTLDRAAKWNGMKDVATGAILVPDVPTPPLLSVIDLFRFRNLRLTTINMWYNWFVNSFVYYGLSLSGGSLVPDLYLNTVLGGAVEIPAYLLTIFLVLNKGRRLPLSAFELLGGVCLLCIAPIPKGKFTNDWPITLFATAGKFCITASFGILFIYAAEIFPTVVRNIGLGTSSMWARVGGLIATFMKLLGEKTHSAVPPVLFGATAIIAGISALWFPETNERKLPETLADGELFLEWSALKKKNRAFDLEVDTVQDASSK